MALWCMGLDFGPPHVVSIDWTLLMGLGQIGWVWKGWVLVRPSVALAFVAYFGLVTEDKMGNLCWWGYLMVRKRIYMLFGNTGRWNMASLVLWCPNIGFKAKSYPYLKLRAKLLNHLEVRTLFLLWPLQDTMNSVRTIVDIIMENWSFMLIKGNKIYSIILLSMFDMIKPHQSNLTFKFGIINFWKMIWVESMQR